MKAALNILNKISLNPLTVDFTSIQTELLPQESEEKIMKLFGTIVKGINYISIDESNIQEIISDIETPAFGFDKKLIVARNTGLF